MTLQKEKKPSQPQLLRTQDNVLIIEKNPECSSGGVEILDQILQQNDPIRHHHSVYDGINAGLQETPVSYKRRAGCYIFGIKPEATIQRYTVDLIKALLCHAAHEKQFVKTYVFQTSVFIRILLVLLNGFVN